MEKENIFIESAETLLNSSELYEEVKTKNNINVREIELDKKSALLLQKNKGKYITIFFDKLSGNVEELINELVLSIKNIFDYLKVKKNAKILVVGLGNKNITADKLGYLVIEKIDVEDNTYKIYKEVESLTNINSALFVKKISQTLSVDLVIVIDSLCARNFDRLNTTIQISTGGITPGSALSRKKDEISFNTLKIPVIAIGVPTIININNLLKKNIKEDFIVSKNNIDLEIENLSSIISIALNRIL